MVAGREETQEEESGEGWLEEGVMRYEEEQFLKVEYREGNHAEVVARGRDTPH